MDNENNKESEPIESPPRYIEEFYAWSWLENINNEKWTKKLIREYIEPFRNPSPGQDPVYIPFGTEGKLIEPPFCRPIPIITVWDAVALLWTIYIIKMGESFKGMGFRDQIIYLSRMMINLGDRISMMDTRKESLPTAINITISTEGEKIVKFMFGASVRSGRKTNTITGKMLFKYQDSIALTRVINIPILNWCYSKIATVKHCNYPWGNCAESLCWYALLEPRVVLWTQAFNIKDREIRKPCSKCKMVKCRMYSEKAVAKIRSIWWPSA
ncbi:unnamed protein product [Rhizophagus irregularis]|nr:unnamed protein product [Rhizophagus irregularis]